MSNNIFGHIFTARQLAFGVNAEQELYSFRQDVQAEMRGVKHCTAPRFLMFKITNQCNSNCVYCDYSLRKHHGTYKHSTNYQEVISLKEVKQIIDEASQLGVLAVAYNGGEPLLYDDIANIIAYTHKNGITPILMSNGLLLSQKWEELGKAGLKYVMISFDSLQEKTFYLQRGVSFAQTMKGIESAVRMRDKFGDNIIHITAVVTRHNLGELCNLAKFCKNHGLWLELCTYHHISEQEDVLSVEDAAQIHDITEQLLEYKRAGFPISTSYDYIQHMPDFFLKKQMKPKNYHCMVGYTTLQIDGYLDVRPCWERSFSVLGNLRKCSIQSLWESKEMEDYRKKMLVGACKGCWNMCNEVTSLINEELAWQE